MRANHRVIKEIMESLDRDDSSLFDKIAGRYGDDSELRKIHRLYELGGRSQEVKTKLRNLHDSRRLSGGTGHLRLKDRRRLKKHTGKYQDY